MKKKLFSIILVVVMALSLNVVAFAGPGGGAEGDPVMGDMPIECPIVYPIECPEDDQGEDDDCDQDQP